MFIGEALKLSAAAAFAFFLLVTGSSNAVAGVVISSTRVIYDAKETEVTLKLVNEGTVPALVQTWIDRGQTDQSPSQISVPFVVTPPVSRIDPGKGQTLRIAYTGEPLPQDKESVFWLNVLEVPPKASPDGTDKNWLQLAFHSRLKLFFRPSNLPGNVQDARAAVTWHLVEANGKPALEADNASAYHVSFTKLDVTAGGRTATSEDGGMVGPGEQHDFPLSSWTTTTTTTPATAPAAQVRYTLLNDLGGTEDGVAPLQAARPGTSLP